MPTTAQDLLNYAAEAYSDFPSATALGLRLLQETHNKICRYVRLYPVETVSFSSLVAGTVEYALDDAVLRIWAATYYSAAGSFLPLRETSVDELDQLTRGWRDYPTGTPNRYFDDGNLIGLVPAPSQASSAGYPTVNCYVTREKVLTTGTAMPANVATYDAWIAGCLELWSFRNDQAQYPKWLSLAKMKLQDLMALSEGRQARNHPKARFDAPRPAAL